MNLRKAIEEVKKEAGKRKFKQTVEMKINLTGIDPKNFTINDVIELPRGINKEKKICAVGTGDFLLKAKKCADVVIDAKKLEKFKDKKEKKKLADEVDFFVVEAPVMAEFAKSFGPVLAPRGKMPLPQHIIPPGGDPCPVVERLRKSVRIVGKKSPVVHTVIGTEDMSIEDLETNAKAVLEYVVGKLPRGKHNLRNIYIKLTMSRPVRVSG